MRKMMSPSFIGFTCVFQTSLSIEAPSFSPDWSPSVDHTIGWKAGISNPGFYFSDDMSALFVNGGNDLAHERLPSPAFGPGEPQSKNGAISLEQASHPSAHRVLQPLAINLSQRLSPDSKPWFSGQSHLPDQGINYPAHQYLAPGQNHPASTSWGGFLTNDASDHTVNDETPEAREAHSQDIPSEYHSITWSMAQAEQQGSFQIKDGDAEGRYIHQIIAHPSMILSSFESKNKERNACINFVSEQVQQTLSPSLQGAGYSHKVVLNDSSHNKNLHDMVQSYDQKHKGYHGEIPGKCCVNSKGFDSEEFKRVFLMEIPEPSVFAWISSMKEIISSQDRKKLEVFNQRFFEEVENSKYSLLYFYNTECRRRYESDTIGINLNDNFRRLFKTIWGLNSQFLEIFGKYPNEKMFENEQIAVQEWLLDLMFFKEGRIFPTDKAASRESIRELKAVHHIKKTILESFCSDMHTPMWRVSMGFASNGGCFVTRQKFFLTRAAVTILGSYYKQTNFTKWKVIFHSDENFLTFFAFMKRNQREHQRENMIEYSSFNINKLFPWKNEWSLNGFEHDRFKNSLHHIFSRPAIQWAGEIAEL